MSDFWTPRNRRIARSVVPVIAVVVIAYVFYFFNSDVKTTPS